MKGSTIYTLIYAAAVGGISALLLAGAAEFTEPYRAANAKAEEVRNILGVLGVPFENGASSAQLLASFEENVRQQTLDDLTLYQYVTDDTVQAVAVRFAGLGLWGPIKGFLSLEPDMETIRGVSFYEQEETPGLGGEIGADWFRDQFKGKTIFDASGRRGISIRRGAAADSAYEVDAITGATMTCDKVEAMLNEVIQRIAKVRE